MKLVANYGELIANYIGGTLWSYNEYGSYQGDYIAVIYKDSNLLLYKGSFGSCSGCDWLQNYDEEISGEEIPDEDVEEYMKDIQPFLVISSDAFPKTEEELVSLLPANTRTWQDNDEFKLMDLLEQINKPTCDNLNLIETEAKNKGLL
jgi:hypothetical protein